MKVFNAGGGNNVESFKQMAFLMYSVVLFEVKINERHSKKNIVSVENFGR